MIATSAARKGIGRIGLLTALGLLVALLPLLPPAGAAHLAAETLRFAGQDRFDTARLIAADAVFAGADTVVIARADDFADALAGALVAGVDGAPLLLSDTDDLPDPTVQAINRIGPIRAVILGGPAAISAGVERRLAAFDSVTTVERIAGADRFDTARRIAERVAGTPRLPLPVGTPAGLGQAPDFGGGQQPRVTAVLATGRNFPDALASGPLSAGGRFPILLTEPDGLPPATAEALGSEALGIEQVLVVGGPGAVSPDVVTAVRDLGLPVERVSGDTRTRTAERVAEFTRTVLYPQTYVADTVALANGRNFPDALALGPLAARRGGPLVITDTPTQLSTPTREFLIRSCAGAGAQEAPMLIGGGPGAVSAEVEQEARDAVVCGDFIPAGGLTVEPETQTVTAGEQAAVTATGTNPKGEPAVNAEITFEVFRDALTLPGSPPEDARIYRESGRLFRKVGGTALNAGSDGVATFSYSHTAATEDRIVVCTPPRELPNPGCTDETGALRADVAWATVVVRTTWIADGGGGLPLPLPPLP